VARCERLRTALWHRVREFSARWDLVIAPTTAIPPFAVELPFPTDVAGKPMTSGIE